MRVSKAIKQSLPDTECTREIEERITEIDNGIKKKNYLDEHLTTCTNPTNPLSYLMSEDCIMPDTRFDDWIRKILEKGAGSNYTDTSIQLHPLCQTKNSTIINLLLEHHANPSLPYSYGESKTVFEFFKEKISSPEQKEKEFYQQQYKLLVKTHRQRLWGKNKLLFVGNKEESCIFKKLPIEIVRYIEKIVVFSKTESNQSSYE